MQSRTSTRGGFSLHQSFIFSFEANELYFLCLGAPAKPGIAKDLIECYNIKPVRKEEGKFYWKIPLGDDDATREK